MVTAYGETHIGHVRKINQDHLLSDPDLGLYLVADGMGGHSAGEVASRLTVDPIRAFVARSQDGAKCTWPFGIDPDSSFATNRLRTAVQLANRRVFRASESNDDYTGMGSTVVAVLVEEHAMTFASVGDSRLYVLSTDGLTQLTTDDSWVAEILARDPEADPDALAAHPMRHVLTNAIGAREETEVEIGQRELAEDDVVLLCSDGLHGELDASLGRFAHRLLTRRGMEIRLDTRLEGATATAARLSTGERLETRTIVTTVPSGPNPLLETLPVELRRGRARIWRCRGRTGCGRWGTVRR